jgi:hypothetical protein
LPFQGKTITIDENGFRKTLNKMKDNEMDSMVAFFGGSTMWGTGVDDENTIPSIFANQHEMYRSINFGETAYTARQNLNLLIQKYSEGFDMDIAIFYDGVNEILHKCRRELGAFSHAREVYIRDAIELYGEGMSYAALFYPIHQLAAGISKEIFGKLKPSYFYDCDQNDKKAELIARALILDWMAAKCLTEGMGDRFIAVLQPVAYIGTPNVSHIKLDEELGRQFVKVYAKIIFLLENEFPALLQNFVNFTAIFNEEEPIYIDFSHVSPNGNQIVATRIAEVLRPGVGKGQAIN